MIGKLQKMLSQQLNIKVQFTNNKKIFHHKISLPLILSITTKLKLVNLKKLIYQTLFQLSDKANIVDQFKIRKEQSLSILMRKSIYKLL